MGPIPMTCLLLLIAGTVAGYLAIETRRKKRLRQQLLDLAGRIREANAHFGSLTNDERYFANYDEQQYLNTHQELRKVIKPKFEKLGLPLENIESIKLFCDHFDCSATIRQDYNNQFVPKEAQKFAAFFANLEKYPLSTDQLEAIIRDEDNNLVIAGAGTGKTTTISAKVAYLLEKKLARPEELLVISFTKNAVKEMHERCMRFCQHIPEAKDLEVRTFNSFGYLVSRKCSSQEMLLAFDGNDEEAKAFLQKQFDELFISDRDFQRKAVNFLGFFDRTTKDRFDFKTLNEYLAYEESVKNVTLDGIKVNSKEEVDIGNFLCLNNIPYEYQRHFPLDEEDRDTGHAAYQPDFYLPEHQIWHEHFGISRSGDVPEWFSAKPPYTTGKEYYQAGIAWKERIHAKYQTRFIKTYSYENHEGTLISGLKQKLISEGVALNPLDPEDMLELFKKTAQYKDYMNLVHTFLGLMKSNGKTPAELTHRGDKRYKVFMDIFKTLYSAYDNHLKAIPAVDYNDMVNHAAQHFRKNAYQKPYKYILVDEFQDMSLGRYELLKAIREQNPGVKLYAVGDDWQSIFRFTGSDISIITQFKKHFGYTSQSAILKTYRFNEQILKASSDFVQKNPSQIRKQLTAQQKALEGHTSFEFIKMPQGNGSLAQFQKAKASEVQKILELITQQESSRQQTSLQQVNTTVFLIGRYKFNTPKDLNELRQLFPKFNISYHTAHGVKGMTCDYAILLDVDSGILGFPSEIADDPLLNYLLNEGDSFENAEERRVFYVAITRARYKNYLLYNESQPSKFLLELENKTNTTPESKPVTCPECNGPMIARKGPYSDFYGCTHYPRCKGKVHIPLMEIAR